ncbi:hypothetical protein BGK72_38480 [Streptomyces agglomeratus]|nr:hypothetical protein BGK72_38480 [Streptomyces agglomeratus]
MVAALRWTDPRATVHPLTGEVRTDPYAGGAAPADQCALEHALRIADGLGGRCLALTAGPPTAEEMLREALAAGAHDVLRVEAPDSGRSDADDTAHALYSVLVERNLRPDVVVCGDRSTDRGTGTTPARLAALFGAAQALGLVELGVDGGELRAVRRLDAGRREVLGVPLPAVCSVEPGAVRLRRAPLAAALAARTAPIPTVSVAAADTPASRIRAGRVRPYRPRPRVLPAPEGDGPRDRLLALTGAHTAPRTPPLLVTPRDPAEAARILLDYLRTRA